MAGREFDLERHFQQNYYCQSTLCKDKQSVITKKRIEKRENGAKDTVCYRRHGHVSYILKFLFIFIDLRMTSNQGTAIEYEP